MTTLRQCSSRRREKRRLSKTLRLFKCRPDLKTFEKSQKDFFRYDAVGKLEELRCAKSSSERIMQRILRLSQQSAYRLNAAAVPWAIRDTAELPGLG